MNFASVPYIDPKVEHVGVSKLRALNATNLRTINTLVIQENDNPLAVLLKYEQYLIMQNQLFQLLEALEIAMNEEERNALRSGLADLKAGRVASISQIRRSLRKPTKRGQKARNAQ